MDFEQIIKELSDVRGTLACAVVDYESGMLLDGYSEGSLDLDILAVGNTEIIRSEIKAIDLLHNHGGQNDQIEDVLMTLGQQYHILRPMRSSPGLFLFSVLSRQHANLALARRAMKDADDHYRG